jgi:hypothetical protein
MRSTTIALVVLAALTLTPASSLADGRAGIFDWHPSRVRTLAAAPTPAADTSPSASPFTFGTLLGLSIPFAEPSGYVVRNNVVVLEHAAEWYDYLQRGVFVLPSVAVYAWRGHALSVIVPAGLTSGHGASYGFGLSLGTAVFRGAEVGLAAALVWTETTRLTEAQRRSLEGGTALGVGEGTIGTAMLPGIVFGVYVAPQL